MFVIYLGGAFLIISILDEVLDFDGYESLTLNGIEYETPQKNSHSEEFESYDKTKEEYLHPNFNQVLIHDFAITKKQDKEIWPVWNFVLGSNDYSF